MDLYLYLFRLLRRRTLEESNDNVGQLMRDAGVTFIYTPKEAHALSSGLSLARSLSPTGEVHAAVPVSLQFSRMGTPQEGSRSLL